MAGRDPGAGSSALGALLLLCGMGGTWERGERRGGGGKRATRHMGRAVQDAQIQPAPTRGGLALALRPRVKRNETKWK